ncbi:VWA containing CoxE family protein [Anaeromyxobacter dehalogenans 2CP-1]|uniref:VWA containing CoxE family protein n=1 Tax=Anaeromyxobacter dehalogenans (strain ATCC BAA-258 / DSM 21875 / 2CP-1) TaxID=455488 RepID=B8JFA7_ANAD2|nr:VWA domain-containing protein [Anaeromyxobacter dehalogenans]ACL64464.1 VWA containing CoxE family protein [Anaeromyxobacter dehalogenans 2CP-1]
MRRNIYDVPKWHLIQHRDARGLPLPATNDSPQLRLADELFERLYAGECEPLSEDECVPALRAWAERIHASCEALPQFSRLAAECRGDASAAAAAVESLLDALGELPPPEAPGPDAAPGTSKDPLRRPLLAACAAASRAIGEVRDAVEGLAGVGFAPGSSTAGGAAGDGRRAQSLAARLRSDSRLRRIALLAGRMKRIAASKRRSRVRHGADEVNDVVQGADLARALPFELARLTDPRRRLDFFRSLLEHQVLEYQLTGSDRLGRGPLVVLLDKSSSMDGGGGERDVWATALALALLEQARAERRTFALVAYNAAPFHVEVVSPGAALPEQALFVRCSGGTSIAAAIERGLEVIAGTRGMLRTADLVLVSDGEDEAGPAAELRARAAELGVSIYGLAIGMPAGALSPWCDEAHGVTDLATLEPSVADALFS